MIEFANIYNVGNFNGNPILAQHYLRYSSIIKRQNWNVPNFDAMEFDEYDNPAAKYLVYRSGDSQIAIGSSRLYPTSLPYMLEQKFSNFVTSVPIPKSNKIWEGSRFCVSEIYPPEIDPPPINESMAGVNPANVWTIYRSEDNGKKTLYGGANHRIFAPSGSDDRARQNDGRSAA